MDNLARLFIAKLRAHGHRPYVHNGGFGIEPSIYEPTATAAPHHDGSSYCYPLGFDDRPFTAILKDLNRKGELIAAVREADDFSSHVAGTDK
jgi:hypothetical protein